MDILLQSLVGIIIVPVYNVVKRSLGLSGTSAAWVLMLIVLLVAVPMAILMGLLTDIAFNLAQPLPFLRAVAQSFLIILGAAEGLYMLSKQRVKK